jgi:ergothioneine biosynthesis protein EgtB
VGVVGERGARSTVPTPTPPLKGRGFAWRSHPGGIALIGHQGAGFAFDNEGPSHRVLLEPFALAGRLVSNGEWEQFIADGGYRTPSLWLADGWDWVNREAISAPLYWREGEQFTHSGWQPRDPAAPVCHISYYEADAFAAWAGARLPTEFEWEAIAQGHNPSGGNQLDGAAPPHPMGGESLFGDCWQFTRSAYLPYPRFAPATGAVGEYNGKFMAGQWVLKGASCATARGHSRASYRNFFYPHQRWQFTGLRLAKDL